MPKLSNRIPVATVRWAIGATIAGFPTGVPLAALLS